MAKQQAKAEIALVSSGLAWAIVHLLKFTCICHHCHACINIANITWALALDALHCTSFITASYTLAQLVSG